MRLFSFLHSIKPDVIFAAAHLLRVTLKAHKGQHRVQAVSYTHRDVYKRQDRDCAICSGMAGVMDALYRQMDEQCAAYLEQITITDIETQLFTQK